MTAVDRYAQLCRALAGERLPTALVDLDAFEANVDHFVRRLGAGGKRLRVATKSLRTLELVRRVRDRAGANFVGVMGYAASEASALVEAGFLDVVVAYPTVQPADLAELAGLNRRAKVALVVDDPEQLAPLERAAQDAGAIVPVLVELDVSFRPAPGIHLGVRRSPLHRIDDAVALARAIAARPGLRFGGVMAYEAHIAGLTDRSPFKSWMNGPKRALKHAARRALEVTRAKLVAALAAAGLPPEVVNGGGSGSVEWCLGEDALTEVTVGSGFLDSHLFDYYRDLSLRPAAMFALQVVRRPSPTLVTCHGGGYVASGEPGWDRVPRPHLPPGLELLPFEAAGEVQTPLEVPPGLHLPLGAPVLFRHAKAGELAEHFREYLLVRGDRIEARAKTYRGEGHAFL